MDYLPIEILSYIFEYLDFPTRREQSTVCKRWYAAYLSVFLLKKSYTELDAVLLEKIIPKYDSLFYDINIRPANLVLKNFNDSQCKKLILKFEGDKINHLFGSHLRSLSLKNCSIFPETLFKLLEECENLQELSLTSCKYLFLSVSSLSSIKNKKCEKLKVSLKKIKHLGISAQPYLNDLILSDLLHLCSSVESVSFPISTLLFSNNVDSRMSLLTFGNLLQQLVKSDSVITQVCLNQTNITSNALASLSCSENINLKSLYLQNCKSLNGYGVQILAQNQINLEILDLSGCVGINDEAVKEICKNLTKLKVLSLNNCIKLTSNCFTGITNLTSLKQLDACGHQFPSEILCLETLNITKLNIKKWILSGFDKLFLKNDEDFADEVFEEPIEDALHVISFHQQLNISNLTHLSIGSSKTITDDTIQLISVHLLNLTSLDISWCSEVTDFGLLGIPTNLKIRGPLNSEDKKYSNSHGYTGLFESPSHQETELKMTEEIDEFMKTRGLIRLNKLKSLNISNTPDVSSFSFMNIFKVPAFPLLQRLNLEFIPRSVNDLILQQITETFPDLLHLSLRYCYHISDAGACWICNLKKLQSLNLSSCDKITKKSLLDISSSCYWLKQVDISMCSSISPTDLNMIRSSLPSNSTLYSAYSGGGSLPDTLQI